MRLIILLCFCFLVAGILAHAEYDTTQKASSNDETPQPHDRFRRSERSFMYLPSRGRRSLESSDSVPATNAQEALQPRVRRSERSFMYLPSRGRRSVETHQSLDDVRAFAEAATRRDDGFARAMAIVEAAIRRAAA